MTKYKESGEPPVLDGVTLRPRTLDGGSALSPDTVFRFTQRGALEFRYVQLAHDGRMDAGRSRGELVRGGDDRVQLVERFTWESRAGGGTNVLEQCD